MTFDTPVSAWGGCGNLYARVRLYDDVPDTGYAPGGLALNGEVEDYNVGISPAGVTLADFSAACVGETPVISWETVSELNNQGFNLYRGLDAANPDTQLNATLIPSQGPGSAQGFMYTWSDDTAEPDIEYFYWLEDVDFAGATWHARADLGHVLGADRGHVRQPGCWQHRHRCAQRLDGRAAAGHDAGWLSWPCEGCAPTSFTQD